MNVDCTALPAAAYIDVAASRGALGTELALIGNLNMLARDNDLPTRAALPLCLD